MSSTNGSALGPSSISVALKPGLAILLIAAAICAPMIWYGVPDGGNVPQNLVWSHNFSSQLAAGEIYPRWLPDMNRGAGSPTFYYYAPLPFYLLAIPDFLFPSLGPTTRLAVGQGLLIALSGLSFFYYACRLADTRTAVICSVLYMLLPYHFEIDLWRRQDLGELSNYVWMPLTLRYAETILTSKASFAGLAISYALLVTSHLPSALLFSICLPAALIIPLYGPQFIPVVLRLTGGIITGLLLAGIYWVPALFIQQYIHPEFLWTSYEDPNLWLIPINTTKLFSDDPEGLFFAGRLLLAIATSTAIFALCFVSAAIFKKGTGLRQMMAPALLTATACFLMLRVSAPIWEHTPLWKVQFPWRVAMVNDFAAAIAALYTLREAFRIRSFFAWVPVIASAVLLSLSFMNANLYALFQPHYSAETLAEREAYVQHELDVPEYIPHWDSTVSGGNTTNITDIGKLTYNTANGLVTILTWKPRIIQLHVSLHSASLVMVRQYYFPNWHATVDGVEIQVVPSRRNGLLQLTIPKGDYTVDLTMTRFAQETLGMLLSLLGILVLIGRKFLPWVAGKFIEIRGGVTSSAEKSL